MIGVKGWSRLCAECERRPVSSSGRSGASSGAAERAPGRRSAWPAPDPVGFDRATTADVRRAWRLLVDDADRIADQITLTLLERDAEVYDRVGPDLRLDVRESTRMHIRRGLEILSGSAQPGGEGARDVWRETGRRRARQGVPLEVVLNAYTLGARVLWQALVERSSTGPADLRVDDAVLLLAGRGVWADLDIQNAVLIDAYRREARRLQRQDLQRQQTVLDALLEGRGADPDFAGEALAVLGIRGDADLACVVALQDGSLDDALTLAEDGLERLGVTAVWHVRAGAHFGLLAGPLPDEPGLAQVFAPHAAGRVGVAGCPDGIAGFAAAYQLATRAAETLPRGMAQVVSVSERLPEVLLAGSPQVAPLLLRETLGDLLNQPEAQLTTLVDTLRALLRHDGSPTHAAEELFCHRNTVIYRLKQIEALTGRHLANPRDKLMLELALLAYDR